MVGIFDSGAGGLSVLREIVSVLPREAYVYYADNAHCPYGDKSAEYVTDRARAVTGFLLGKGADIIVVACNTATSAAIETLRGEYSDPSDPEVRSRVLGLTGGRRDHVAFIGMEPAVKPAAALTRNGVVGVLATAGTLSGSKYLDARDLYSDRVRIVEQPGRGFVEMVETGMVDEESVERSLRPLLEAGADTIVLGCTHYPFLLDSLQKAALRLAPDREVVFIDPAPAVASHLVSVMKSEGLLPCGEDKRPRVEDNGSYGADNGPVCEDKGPKVELYASGPDKTLLKLYQSIL